MPRYGMVVDLNSCVGCQTCTIACKHANDTPPGVQWRKVLDVERGTYPDVERLFLVTGCQHCAEPPCVPVCPTGATRQRADGLVTMDYDTCIGCGYCAVACPYQARTIGHDNDWYYHAPTRQEEHVRHDERAGVAHKCTFCVERVDEAEALGLTPGVDLAYTPACAASCIAQALHFGDFGDPDSNVSRLAAENESFQMHAELGTDPQIRYLYEVPATVPGRETSAAEAVAAPGDPLAGERQTNWDVRAATNFTLGGMGSGLAVMATLAYFYGAIKDEGLLLLFQVAGGLMALGLLFVFFEIGRKLRFIYVLLRPQSSWMTRETYAVAVFYTALAIDLYEPGLPAHVLIGLSAAAFLFCQARILYAAKGIPAWRAPLIPWLIVVSGLFEGVGLYAIVQTVAGRAVWAGVVLPACGFVLAVASTTLWHVYRRSALAHGISVAARHELDAVTEWLHVVGHALPALMFFLAFGLGGLAFATLFFAGLGAVIGGVIWKYTVITRACHQQGFALPMLPQRGSGARAAPPRLAPEFDKPGR